MFQHDTNVGDTERVLSTLGGGTLLYLGLRQRSPTGWLGVAIGGALVYRGMTGYCAMYERMGVSSANEGYEVEPIEITETLTINKPRAEVYRAWQKLENLPRFMTHLDTVRELGAGKSFWQAQVPGYGKIEWYAETTTDEENERIAWRSLAGADLDNSGEVRFSDASDGRGTVVQVNLTYRPPVGLIGAAAARLLNPITAQGIKEEVRRFKQFMETGEIATTEGQPSGRTS